MSSEDTDTRNEDSIESNVSGKLAVVGAVVTAAYFTVGAVLYHYRQCEFHSLTLNELGDFLAGYFGPLALGWLVLGYFQQKSELAQNTSALILQHEELRQSVAQQKQLVEATENVRRDERERMRLELSPYISVVNSESYILEAFRERGNIPAVALEIYNAGNTPAEDLLFEVDYIGFDLESQQFGELHSGSVNLPGREFGVSVGAKRSHVFRSYLQGGLDERTMAALMSGSLRILYTFRIRYYDVWGVAKDLEEHFISSVVSTDYERPFGLQSFNLSARKATASTAYVLSIKAAVPTEGDLDMSYRQRT